MIVGYGTVLLVSGGPIEPECGCLSCNPPPAEGLIDVAEVILFPEDRVLETPPTWNENHTARARFALAFYRTPPAFRLRAMVEGWDYPRIVREMY